MTTQTTPASQRTVQLPSARTMFGAVIVACILLPFAAFLGDIVFTDDDPYRNEGPVDSFINIGVVGGAALVIAVGVGALLVRSPERARIGLDREHDLARGFTITESGITVVPKGTVIND